jgi:hypothetical protein
VAGHWMAALVHGDVGRQAGARACFAWSSGREMEPGDLSRFPAQGRRARPGLGTSRSVISGPAPPVSGRARAVPPVVDRLHSERRRCHDRCPRSRIPSCLRPPVAHRLLSMNPGLAQCPFTGSSVASHASAAHGWMQPCASRLAVASRSSRCRAGIGGALRGHIRACGR